MGVFIGPATTRCQVVKELDGFFIEGGLVAFECQQIVGFSVQHRLRRLDLTTHGIGRHQTTRNIQFRQQFRNRNDLVFLVLQSSLSQHQSAARCPGADQLQRMHSLTFVMRTTQLFAVNCHNFAFNHRAQRGGPCFETCLKAL